MKVNCINCLDLTCTLAGTNCVPKICQSHISHTVKKRTVGQCMFDADVHFPPHIQKEVKLIREKEGIVYAVKYLKNNGYNCVSLRSLIDIVETL